VFNPVECSRKSQKRQEKKKKTKKMKEKNRCLSAKFLWHSFRSKKKKFLPSASSPHQQLSSQDSHSLHQPAIVMVVPIPSSIPLEKVGSQEKREKKREM